MRYETWATKFKPIKNHLTGNTAIEGCVFLKHGPDLEFVRRQPEDNVWTFIVSDEGRRPVWLISDGFHYANAMGYLVTQARRKDDQCYDIRY